MAKAAQIDVNELLKELDDEDTELFAELERKRKEAREKKLAAVLEPLRKEKEGLFTEIKDRHARVMEIDKDIERLTGKVQKKAGGGTRQKKRTADEVKADAVKAIKIIKSKGKSGAVKADFAECGVQGTPKAWLEKYGEAKIRTEGAKASMRYFID